MVFILSGTYVLVSIYVPDSAYQHDSNPDWYHLLCLAYIYTLKGEGIKGRQNKCPRKC